MCGCGHQGGVCGIAHRQVSRSRQLCFAQGRDARVSRLALEGKGEGWAQAGIIKDAGDDPDVTHGCTVIATVRMTGKGITFKAGIRSWHSNESGACPLRWASPPSIRSRAR